MSSCSSSLTCLYEHRFERFDQKDTTELRMVSQSKQRLIVADKGLEADCRFVRIVEANFAFPAGNSPTLV